MAILGGSELILDIFKDTVQVTKFSKQKDKLIELLRVLTFLSKNEYSSPSLIEVENSGQTIMSAFDHTHIEISSLILGSRSTTYSAPR